MTGSELDDLQKFAVFWANYGQHLVTALIALVVGIIILKRCAPLLRRLSLWAGLSERVTNEVITGFYVLCSVILLGFVLRQLGIAGPTIRQLLMAGGLVAAALLLLLRPYLPRLPFIAGNLIKTGDILGKVEDISLLNTRLKTFDGLIVMVPNARILNEFVINYHNTPNRRVRLNLAIRYDQDIVHAKKIVESLMIEDPRILPTPRPVVYVMNLADSWVEIGGRGWVRNPKAWVTRCELLEKIRYRFNREGIQVAFPRHDVHVYDDTPSREPERSNPDDVVTSMLSGSLHTEQAQLISRES